MGTGANIGCECDFLKCVCTVNSSLESPLLLHKCRYPRYNEHLCLRRVFVCVYVHSKASSSLDAMKSFCRHFTETLKLAEDQRFAHEYGDITVSTGQTVLEETADTEITNAEKFIGHSQMEFTEKIPAVMPSRNNMGCSYWTFEEKSFTESWPHTLDTITTVPKTGLNSLATKGKASSSNFEMAALSNHQDLDLKK